MLDVLLYARSEIGSVPLKISTVKYLPFILNAEYIWAVGSFKVTYFKLL